MTKHEIAIDYTTVAHKMSWGFFGGGLTAALRNQASHEIEIATSGECELAPEITIDPTSDTLADDLRRATRRVEG